MSSEIQDLPLLFTFISLLFQIFLFKNNNNPTHINKIGGNIIIWIKLKINYVTTSLNCLGLN